MRKAVNNLLKTPLTLGGVKISGKTQRVVRESLITDEEKTTIQKLGAVLTISNASISVELKTDIEARAKAEADVEAEAKAKKEAKDELEIAIKERAFPIEFIKKDGTLNASNSFKTQIEELVEAYGELILDDKTFMEKYPDADINLFRVEVGA